MNSARPSTGAFPAHAPRPPAQQVRLLRWLLILGIASTTIHYAHNFVHASMYPPVPILFPTALAYQIGIAIFYPLLTFVVVVGYRYFQAGRLRAAGWACVAYSLLGATSPGHFLGGNPDIPAVFYVTIFTDGLTGLAILAFGVLTLRRADEDRRREAVTTTA